MEKYPIEPNDCLILKAFRDTSSLRDAAQALGCDPAGLARRVRHISSEHGLIQKINNRWQVTPRGLDLVAWIENSIQTQKKILMGKSCLRVASTMWFSEELLVPHLPKLFKSLEPDTTVSIVFPVKDFELSLLEGSVDFVIVCHPPENPEIEHRLIAQEEWVLVAPLSWQKELNQKGGRPLEILKKKPFIRHSDINLDLFRLEGFEVAESGISINHLAGIRAAVCAELGWSIVPKILVNRCLEEKKLIQVPFEIPIRDRNICIWWLRNRYDSRRQAGKISSWMRQICH